MGMSQNSGAPRPYIMNETCRVWGTPILSIPMYGHNPYESTSVMKWQRVLNTAQLFFFLANISAYFGFNPCLWKQATCHFHELMLEKQTCLANHWLVRMVLIHKCSSMNETLFLQQHIHFWVTDRETH
jgi:hypothetical protein